MKEQQNISVLDPGIYPFWFWNGDIEESEMRWQIAQMSEQGIKGFYIHSRQGLKRPYLAEAFMKLASVAVDTAAEYGMTAHLYDEYPYPSGIAGGEVVQENPGWLAVKLVHHVVDTEGGDLCLELPAGKVLSCKAFRIDNSQIDWENGVDLKSSVGSAYSGESYNEMGMTKYANKRYFASGQVPALETTLPEGRYRIVASVQTIIQKHKYWGWFADVLNPDAVKCFIDLTHEKYKKIFGDKFGKHISSIFTDETHPGWSILVPKVWQEKYREDFADSLPALADPEHPEHIAVSARHRSLVCEMFFISFDKQIQKWCSSNNIKYAGEKEWQRLSQLSFFDIPGCDAGHTRSDAGPDYVGGRIRKNARACASAAQFYGKEGALCECYHSLGWGATLQDARLIADGLAIMGISYLVPHAFFYTTHSMAKHDAPPSFFFQMPFWKYFKQLSIRFDRIWQEFAGTVLAPTILIVEPHGGMLNAVQLQEYEELMSDLLQNHREFCHVDTDILAVAEVSSGKVVFDDIKADVIIIPEMQAVEGALSDQLSRLAEKGALLIRMGEDDVLQKILSITEPGLPLKVIGGEPEKLVSVCRSGPDDRRWLLLNRSNSECGIEIDLPESIYEIPLEDNIPALLVKDGDRYLRKLSPFEAVLLAEGSADDKENPHFELLKINVPEDLKMRPLMGNSICLDKWELKLVGKNCNVEQSAEVNPKPIANQLADAGLSFVPEVQEGFGVMPELSMPELELSYACTFQSDYDGAVNLVMEPGSIRGEWGIAVNDSTELNSQDFKESDYHVRGSVAADITALIKKGENIITVNVKTGQLDGGLLNPLYLYGEFGVLTDPLLLTEQLELGEFHNWHKNRLPFFAGDIEYSFEVEISDIPDQQNVLVEFEFPVNFDDCCEISFNNGPWHIRPWSPYKLIVPSSQLKKGSNQVRIKVSTSLENSFL
ncbi:MAG: hypothetical protein ACYTFY_05570 [Planctomycetota bacterium]|jgi:hypothetical protein